VATKQIKSQGAQAAGTLVDLAQALPGGMGGTVQRALVRMLNRAGRAMGVHTIVTNVPGPQVPMYFCGARMVFATGMAPVVDGMGLINAVGSYGGVVPICFTADRDMMPDPEFYTQCIDESVNDLIDRAEA
jgi:diacylglycerol O-acyltransferase / wax synthase